MKRMDYDESSEELAFKYSAECHDKFKGLDLMPRLDGFKAGRLSARESLAIALRALEKTECSCYFETGVGEAVCARCAAIAEITKRGDYIPEGKG